MSSVALITDTPPFSPPPSPPPSPVVVYMDAPQNLADFDIKADYFHEICCKACNDDEPHAHYCCKCMNETDDEELIENYYNSNFYCIECLKDEFNDMDDDEEYIYYLNLYCSKTNTPFELGS